MRYPKPLAAIKVSDKYFWRLSGTLIRLVGRPCTIRTKLLTKAKTPLEIAFEENSYMGSPQKTEKIAREGIGLGQLHHGQYVFFQ